MENFLPTLAIVMTEIALVLLILVGFLVFRLHLQRRLHETELDTLMGLAGVAGKLQDSPPTPVPTPRIADVASQAVTDTAVPAPDAEIPPATSRAGEVNDVELEGHIDAALSEIRAAMEHLDSRLDQFRHEHTLLAGQFRKLVEEGNNEVHYSRRDLDRIFQVVNDLRRQLGDLSGNLHTPGQVAATRPPTVAHERVQPPPANAPAGTRSPPPSPVDTKVAQTPVPPATTAEPASGIWLEGIAVEEINISDLDVEDPHGLKDGRPRPSRFDEDRIFFQSSLEDGLEQGWYFTGYGERPQGPFADRAAASRVMQELHDQLQGSAAGERQVTGNP